MGTRPLDAAADWMLGMRSAPERQLLVRLGAIGELDMGKVRASSAGQVVEPPGMPLYDQVLAILDSLPPVKPWKPREFPRLAGAATATMCVRWSTWLALLADPDRPLWRHAGDREVSAIANPEMARINIEASYALSRWIDLLREDRPRWECAAAKVLHYLPRAGRVLAPSRESPLVLALHPGVPGVMVSLPDESRREIVARVEANSTRLFANVAMLVGYRNGHIEDVHAGRDEGLPLELRRISAADEATVVESAGAELAVAIDVAQVLADGDAPWAERLLPFAMPFWAWSEARGWSTTEASRVVLFDANDAASARALP